METDGSGKLGEIGSKGKNALMGERAAASFNISSAAGSTAESHIVKAQNITDGQVTITVSSEPTVFTLTSGKSKNVDINGDNYREVTVTLNRVIGGKADITVKEIKIVKINNAPPGSLVKIASLSAVYYLGEDSQRYVFPNERVFYSWYDNFDGVKVISSEDMAKLPLGGLITYRPGTWMVTFVTTADVWTVTQGGVLRKLKDEQMAKDLYGENWNQHIHDINDAFYASYVFGDDLETAAQYNKESQKGNAPTITVDKNI